MREIIIDGITYVPKTPEGSYYIVRTASAGVFAGYIKEHNGQEVKLTEARRLWHWKGAASLSQLSVDGVSCPKECKFPCEVPDVTLYGVIEMLPCSDRLSSQSRRCRYGLRK